jgi:hypothetical protein
MTIAASALRIARVPNSVSSQVKRPDLLRGSVNLRERSRGFLQTPYLFTRAGAEGALPASGPCGGPGVAAATRI